MEDADMSMGKAMTDQPINNRVNNVEIVLCVRSDLLRIVGEALKGTKINLGMNESLGGILMEDTTQ